MKIDRITVTHHRLALEPPFHASWDSRPRTHFDATIVRVAADEGHEGVGSGAMLGFAGQESLFLGRDPLDLKRHWKVLDNLSFHYASPEARWQRIAGGEMAREMHELHALIASGCLDVLQPDAALAGGITGLIPVARRAAQAGLEFSPHTWTNGLGLAANAHLTAGLGGTMYLEYPLDAPEWTPERRDFMLRPPSGFPRRALWRSRNGRGWGSSWMRRGCGRPGSRGRRNRVPPPGGGDFRPYIVKYTRARTNQAID